MAIWEALEIVPDQALLTFETGHLKSLNSVLIDEMGLKTSSLRSICEN